MIEIDSNNLHLVTNDSIMSVYIPERLDHNFFVGIIGSATRKGTYFITSLNNNHDFLGYSGGNIAIKLDDEKRESKHVNSQKGLVQYVLKRNLRVYKYDTCEARMEHLLKLMKDNRVILNEEIFI